MVLSPDHTSPTVVVAVYYNIGFRIEPRDRTGFAHLFEHLMFQGSKNLGKMEFIKLVQSNGGILNGSTRFDFTNYFEVVPANVLKTALWAEADRMRGLAISQDNLVNQQGVVKNEVKVNVLNRPYGGFPWLDMPQVANENWFNAHNFYGDLKDLDAATLEGRRGVLQGVLLARTTPPRRHGRLRGRGRRSSGSKEYFASIPSVPHREAPGHLRAPAGEGEDGPPRATSWRRGPRSPSRTTRRSGTRPSTTRSGLLDQILAGGNDSRLHEALVRKARGLTGEVDSSINGLGQPCSTSRARRS